MVSLQKIKKLQKLQFYCLAVLLVALASFTVLSTRSVVSTYQKHQTKLLLSDELHNRCQIACAAGEQVINKSTPFLATLNSTFGSVTPPSSFLVVTKSVYVAAIIASILYVCIYARSRYKLAAYAYWLN